MYKKSLTLSLPPLEMFLFNVSIFFCLVLQGGLEGQKGRLQGNINLWDPLQDQISHFLNQVFFRHVKQLKKEDKAGAFLDDFLIERTS